MRVMIDTSILVAAFVQSHPHHTVVTQWLIKAKNDKTVLMISAHSLAECYAVLTRLPVSPKISPEIAYRILHDNVPKLGKCVSLDAENYLAIIAELSLAGLTGGIVHDAIILKTAQKNRADKLATLNRKHFLQLSSDEDYILSL